MYFPKWETHPEDLSLHLRCFPKPNHQCFAPKLSRLCASLQDTQVLVHWEGFPKGKPLCITNGSLKGTLLPSMAVGRGRPVVPKSTFAYLDTKVHAKMLVCNELVWEWAGHYSVLYENFIGHDKGMILVFTQFIIVRIYKQTYLWDLALIKWLAVSSD